MGGRRKSQRSYLHNAWFRLILAELASVKPLEQRCRAFTFGFVSFDLESWINYFYFDGKVAAKNDICSRRTFSFSRSEVIARRAFHTRKFLAIQNLNRLFISWVIDILVEGLGVGEWNSVFYDALISIGVVSEISGVLNALPKADVCWFVIG